MSEKPHIALLMMLKNEEKHLHVSLNSVIGIVSSLIIFDTGSTDQTIPILKNFAKKHNLPLHLKNGEFVNFEVSRNESLEFADTFNEADYLLLMDCSDELRGGKKLLEFATSQMEYKDKYSLYLICQEWKSGNKIDKYYNTRFIRPHCGWRYKGVVHEYMLNIIKPGLEKIMCRVDIPEISLFQDRNEDGEKSKKRFSRDKVLLLEAHKKDPIESRTIFYLAQTCSCLGHHEDAVYYYKQRLACPNPGFWEELFHSHLRIGETCEKMFKHPWPEVIKHYISAFEVCERVEPLINIARHYRGVKKWQIAYMYIRHACELPYPNKCILFVDKTNYDYVRWHEMGIIAYYVGKYSEGKKACIKAIVSMNLDLDKKNLKFYDGKNEDKLNLSTSFGTMVNNMYDEGGEKKDIAPLGLRTSGAHSATSDLRSSREKPPATKKAFIQWKIRELKKSNSSLTDKQYRSKAQHEWKNRKNKNKV